MRKRAVAATDHRVPACAYFAQSRARRDRLAHESALAATHLDSLRLRAAERYGAMRLIEGAADSFVEEAERSAARAEMARIDDLTAARIARNRHAARARAAATRS